jgi:predicted DNA repair protein MutK
MASSLLALLDDIATILDDVSVMTKVATKKTAGVLGDDLALNAQQVSGVKPDRELPVVWAVAKGSAVNKLILVPAALAISAFEGWLAGRGIAVPIVTALMMVGGAFLCYEGVEKLAHKFLHRPEEKEKEVVALLEAVADESVDLVEREKDKIKGAIRTDFILSAEIIVITLGTVAAKDFTTQVGVLAAIAVIMTIGVYGLVAGIVKLDDAGLFLSQLEGERPTRRLKRALGRGILTAAPWLMKFLAVAGTAAMFLVGGSILVHSIPVVHHFVQGITPAGGWGTLVTMLAEAGFGILAGIAVVLGVTAWGKLRGKDPAAAH